MEVLNAIYDFFKLLLTTRVPVSLFSLAIFTIILCSTVIAARYKFGLLLALFSIFVWGFMANLKYFVELFNYNTVGLIVYGVGGVSLLTLIIVSVAIGHQER